MYLSAKTQGCTRSIHSNISATDHSNLLAYIIRSLVAFLVCEKQIVASQKFVCRNYTTKIFARNLHEIRQTSTRTNENCFEMLLVHKFVDRNRTTYDDILLKLSTEFLQILNLVLYNGMLWQTERRNAIHKYASIFVQSLKNGNIVAHSQKFLCTGKSRRSTSDNSHLVSVLLNLYAKVEVVFARPITDKTLKFANRNRFALYAENALALALCFLRTNATADSRQSRILVDYPCCGSKITFSNFSDKIWNLN